MVRAKVQHYSSALRPQEDWAEQIPPSLLTRTFPIPYATLRNGSLSERALVTLGRNDNVVRIGAVNGDQAIFEYR